MQMEPHCVFVCLSSSFPFVCSVMPSCSLYIYVRTCMCVCVCVCVLHSIQVEGYNFMHFAEVEVFGSPGTRVKIGKVTHVACGNQVTAVTMAPELDAS